MFMNHLLHMWKRYYKTGQVNARLCCLSLQDALNEVKWEAVIVDEVHRIKVRELVISVILMSRQLHGVTSGRITHSEFFGTIHQSKTWVTTSQVCLIYCYSVKNQPSRWERERESVCVCERGRERECVCVCVRESTFRIFWHHTPVQNMSHYITSLSNLLLQC